MAERVSVLLVEDNPGDAALIQAALEDGTGPHDLKHVENLRDALDAIGASFDVVLLDLNLPDSSGAETFEQVLAGAKDVPVVVLTGADDEELGARAVSRGVQDYIAKGSLDARGLGRCIRYSIERKRLEVELRKLNATLEQRVRERTAELEQSIEALGQEVSEHERAAAGLREARERFYEMLDAIPVAIWISAANTYQTIYCNKHYAAISGRQRDILYSEPRAWLETIHPDDRQLVQDQVLKWLEVARERPCHSLEITFRAQQPTGRTLWLASRLFGVYRGSGEMRYVCGLAEETQPPAAPSPRDGVIVLDEAGRIREWAAQRQTGIAADEAVGRHLSEMLDRMARPGLWSRLRGTMRPPRAPLQER